MNSPRVLLDVSLQSASCNTHMAHTQRYHHDDPCLQFHLEDRVKGCVVSMMIVTAGELPSTWSWGFSHIPPADNTDAVFQHHLPWGRQLFTSCKDWVQVIVLQEISFCALSPHGRLFSVTNITT